MTRPVYPSDEAHNDRRRKGPRPGSYYITHHSVTNHPKMVEVYANDHLYAAWHRLLGLASEKGAAHTANEISLSRQQMMVITASRDCRTAARLLQDLCRKCEYRARFFHKGCIIEIRNFAIKQGLTPRDKRKNSAIPLSSSSSSSLQEKEIHMLAKASERANGADRGESPAFLAFYAAYPRKVGRPDAWKAWRQVGGDELSTVIMAGLERWKHSRQWRDPQYVKYPAAWLRASHWNDEPTPVQEGGFVG